MSSAEHPWFAQDTTFPIAVRVADVTPERLLALRGLLEAHMGGTRVEMILLNDATATVVRLPAVLGVTPSWDLRRRVVQLFSWRPSKWGISPHGSGGQVSQSGHLGRRTQLIQ